LLPAALVAAWINVGAASGHVHEENYTTVLCIVGTLAWLLSYLILSFLASVLLNVVEAAYACLVLDLDRAIQSGAFRQPAMSKVIVTQYNPTFVLVNPSGMATLAQAVEPDLVVRP